MQRLFVILNHKFLHFELLIFDYLSIFAVNPKFSTMELQTNKKLLSVFDQIKKIDEVGKEYWLARQLAKVLKYKDYRNFHIVLEKAKADLLINGHRIKDHIVDTNEMVNIGSGAKREIIDYKLSRYACYFVLENSDIRKTLVAQGLRFFSSYSSLQTIDNHNIKDVIYSIDGQQVILDKDLARLYQTDTRTLKQAVKRNHERFPADFMFELTDVQISTMVSQFVIPSRSHFGGSKPLAFTEEGVAMLSSILRSSVAIEMSLTIIRTFVELRKQLINNALILQRINRIEIKQVEADHKFEQVFQALENKDFKPEKGVFYKDTVFDAYAFVSDIIREANKSIILIDNYVDDTLFTLLNKRKRNVEVTIYTSQINKQLELDLLKYNSQYPPLKIYVFREAHDRFLIVDKAKMYHFGASLKDLGKKWFAFSRMDTFVDEVLQKLRNYPPLP